MLIDAHHHLWRYNDRDYGWMSNDMIALRQNYLLPELEQVTRASGVTGTIAVQARQTLEETESLLQMAAANPLLQGVVGWVPLIAPNVPDDLDRFAADPRLKGVRHVLHDEQDAFYMLRDDFNRGVSLLASRGLAYDILIFEKHLPQTLTFVDRHPNQIFVVDHVAKPKIRAGELSPWQKNLAELARRENVYCKISGMATEADWTAWTQEQLRPYFDAVLQAFGPSRLMFGSDWPVLTLAGSYQRWVETFRWFIADLSPHEQEQIGRGTAIRAYRL